MEFDRKEKIGPCDLFYLDYEEDGIAKYLFLNLDLGEKSELLNRDIPEGLDNHDYANSGPMKEILRSKEEVHFLVRRPAHLAFPEACLHLDAHFGEDKLEPTWVQYPFKFDLEVMMKVVQFRRREIMIAMG